MKEIPLTKGKFALVDDEDYEYLMQWKWRLSDRYAARWSRKHEGFEPRRLIYMHRVIHMAPEDMMVDHKNQIELDNRRSNLRTASDSQNMGNRKISRNNKVGAKGVCFHNGRFQASINIDHKSVYLGRFSTAEEANAAYAKAAKEHFGEFSRS